MNTTFDKGPEGSSNSVEGVQSPRKQWVKPTLERLALREALTVSGGPNSDGPDGGS
jgi:hypothetical protein